MLAYSGAAHPLGGMAIQLMLALARRPHALRAVVSVSKPPKRERYKVNSSVRTGTVMGTAVRSSVGAAAMAARMLSTAWLESV